MRASRRASKTAGIPEERYGSSGVPAVARFKLPIVESEMQPVADGRRQAEGKAAADGRRPKETQPAAKGKAPSRLPRRQPL
ncbi:hypothetical protein A4H34_03020 [Peptidiphaga gingivicola]|uniref:Uncharacterized protein n=1 Tax=Peptidiphaga gingivicola TaxID=2741497 RepID=A0A179B4W7_9ACTO|nr:hypothetical protein A4H34_03020 [Peptidiphaga gingivicola]